MSDQQPSTSNESSYNDGLNDAFASVAVIAIIVGAVVFWLHGMPT